LNTPGEEVHNYLKKVLKLLS